MAEMESCDNCGEATENEPARLCDYCMDVGDGADALRARVAELEAETKRLREALERIQAEALKFGPHKGLREVYATAGVALRSDVAEMGSSELKEHGE